MYSFVCPDILEVHTIDACNHSLPGAIFIVAFLSWDHGSFYDYALGRDSNVHSVHSFFGIFKHTLARGLQKTSDNRLNVDRGGVYKHKIDLVYRPIEEST